MKTTRSRTPYLIPLAAFAILASACAAGPRSADGTPAPEHAALSVVVDNQTTEEISLWVVRDGTKRRLGSVGAQSRKEFEIGDVFIAGAFWYRLRADRVGAPGGYATRELDTSYATALWTITGHPATTSLVQY